MSELRRWCAEQGAAAVALELQEDGSLWWSVNHAGTTVLQPGRLQLLTTDERDLLRELRVTTEEASVVHETYELVVGKQVGTHQVSHHQQVIRFAAADLDVSVVLRAAVDGVALRLVLHDAQGLKLTGSDVPLAFPPGAAAWPLVFTPWYEMPRFSATLDALAPADYGFPLLIRATEDVYALVTESDLDGRYGGSLVRYRGGGRFDVTLVDEVSLDRAETATPWRVVVLGGLDQIVASDLVNELAPPAAAAPPEWVKPGRAAWSWWSDFFSGAHLDQQLRLLDYAADRGWEYLLVDCGWDAAWMPDLVAAASEYGIGVFVWTSWSDVADAEQRQRFAEWASWGVAGIKVDFMESEAQERYRWYDAVIAECARVGLMVNFHGSVIPRGWQRTHPHVVSYEAVRGAEYYAFYGDPLTPEHNTILPFTRGVVGSADYTPVTFSARGRRTSEAHELALSVVVESGVQHFADAVEEYSSRPLAQRFLEQVPAAWDETRYLAGEPGTVAAIARRKGSRWYVGVVSAQPATTLEVPLIALEAGPLKATLVVDGAAGHLVAQSVDLAARQPLILRLVENGGAVVVFTTRVAGVPGSAQFVDRPRLRIEQPVATIVPGGLAEVTAEFTGAGAVRMAQPPGWLTRPAAVQVKPRTPDGATRSRWTVRAPEDLPPGHVAILTVVAAVDGARPVVAHARLVTPLRDGATALASLRPVAASNGCGPVERDSSNGGGDPRDGRPMTVAGITYERGLGVCVPSSIAYHLGGSTDLMTVMVGVDDETPGSRALCTVLVDRIPRARIEVAAGQPATQVQVDLRAAAELTLLAEASEPSATPAHVDWAEPVLHVTADRTSRQLFRPTHR